MECAHGGKHGGTVKRRNVLRFNGVLLNDKHATATCDRHYALSLRHAVARGAAAAKLLAKLESK